MNSTLSHVGVLVAVGDWAAPGRYLQSTAEVDLSKIISLNAHMWPQPLIQG